MKKLIYSGLLAAALLGASAARADFYAGIGYGASFNDGSATTNGAKFSYHDSAIYALTGGYEFPLPLLDVRVEGEYLRTKPEVKYGKDRKLDALMLNVIGVIPLVPLVDPYVGLGLGYGRYDHTNTSLQQLLLGVEYELPVAPIVLGGEYRHLRVNETCGKANSPSKLRANIFMLKAKYFF